MVGLIMNTQSKCPAKYSNIQIAAVTIVRLRVKRRYGLKTENFPTRFRLKKLPTVPTESSESWKREPPCSLQSYRLSHRCIICWGVLYHIPFPCNIFWGWCLPYRLLRGVLWVGEEWKRWVGVWWVRRERVRCVDVSRCLITVILCWIEGLIGRYLIVLTRRSRIDQTGRFMQVCTPRVLQTLWIG